MAEEYNEAYEEWKERVDHDFEHLDPEKSNADVQIENPTSYDFTRVGYRLGRVDGVKEVVRDLRRCAQFHWSLDSNPHSVITREDVFEFIDKWYERIGEWKKQK